MNQETASFIAIHSDDDVRQLALKGCPAGVDLSLALDQISGRQTARRKLPTWAATEGIVYPPHLNMEQCSSEQTASYKATLCQRLNAHDRLIDMTGGLGVDFSFMAKHFKQATYVEQQQHLCELATHNFPLLGVHHAEIKNTDSIGFIDAFEHASMLFLDPARRDGHGRRTYALEDCMPDITALHHRLLKKCDWLLVKLSPMFDWHQAAEQLDGVREVHILSVKNECKELLLLLSEKESRPLRVVCVNDDERFEFFPTAVSGQKMLPMTANWGENAPRFLYEPNSSVMKAGCFDAVAQAFGITPVGHDSHLFVSEQNIEDFIGRKFQICAISSMNKHELKRQLAGIVQANVAVRNFPMSAQELQRKLRLKDGGDTYIFGTTTAERQHLLFICRKN